MKKQRAKNSQDNLDEEQKWRTYTLDITIYHKATLVETAWYLCKDRKIDQ